MTLRLTVDVSPIGGGAVEVDHAAPSFYPFTYYFPGVTEVILEAVPAPGHDFVSWSGHLTGSTNPVDVTIDCNKSITANFSVEADSGWAYDVNEDGVIDIDEVLAAIVDYFDEEINISQVLDVIALYLSRAH